MTEVLKQGWRRFILHYVLLLLGLTVVGLAFEALTPAPGNHTASGGGFIGLLGGAANFVSEIAAQAGWLILPVTVVWLLIRRLFALAVYVASVAVGMAVLVGGGMYLMTSSLQLLGPDSGSGSVFSSGSIQLTVTGGALLLVFLPAVPAKGRTWAVAGTAATMIVFDGIRIFAGAVPFAPVLGAWLLGIGWLAGTVWAYHGRQRFTRPRSWWSCGISAQDRAALAPAPIGDPPLPGGRSSVFKLAGIWLLIATGVTGAGFLITGILTSVRRWDQAVVQWLAGHRTDALSSLATAAGSFGTTAGIVGVLLVAAPLALAITRRSAPAVFLLVAVIGETALYLLSGMIVGRPRPDVDHLTEGLPPTSSFPSGHVAAAVVMYGGLALLVSAWTRSQLYHLGFILAPLIVLGVSLSRLYWGVHYPTDAIASLIFASLWLAFCWWYFEPARGAPSRTAERVPEALSGPHRGEKQR